MTAEEVPLDLETIAASKVNEYYVGCCKYSKWARLGSEVKRSRNPSLTSTPSPLKKESLTTNFDKSGVNETTEPLPKRIKRDSETKLTPQMRANLLDWWDERKQGNHRPASWKQNYHIYDKICIAKHLPRMSLEDFHQIRKIYRPTLKLADFQNKKPICATHSNYSTNDDSGTEVGSSSVSSSITIFSQPIILSLLI